MTEKRYKIDLTNSPLLSYIDMVTGEKYPITEDGIYSICDLLNELHEENQRLKRKNKRLHRDWDKLYDLCLDKGCTEDEIIKELER